MSSNIEQAVEEVCASCGIMGGDNIKLKICTACKLVKYCSVECQKNHRKQHKKACKKRLTEICDDRLFTQPDGNHNGECPICCLPIPIDLKKSSFMNCCSKSICNGCGVANKKREHEAGLYPRCAFCREPMPKSEEEGDKNMMNRVKKNDPVAMCFMGSKRYREGAYEIALEYLTNAAGLGNAMAHHNLSTIYENGEGVERDEKKQTYHLEEAAIGGHPMARHNLGIEEWNNDRYDKARKHFIIAANLGSQGSLSNVKKLYADGHASKEDYANALRGYQAAVDEAKSPERDEAETYFRAAGLPSKYF